MSKNPKRLGGAGTAIAMLLILALIAATGYFVWLCVDMVNLESSQTAPTDAVIQLPTEAAGSETEAPTETTVPPTTVPPVEPETVVATATISSQGDLLMHKPVFDSCRVSGGYDFSSIFKYTKDYVSSYDYALANLETTFGGDDFVYQGNPAFNCPDQLADAVVDAGYDMLLTANNHCGDTMAAGVARTLEHSRSKGLATLGTQLSDEEPKFAVVDINGIKVGMVCYSWAFNFTGSKVSMNGLTPIPADGTINFFMNNNLPAFYEELKNIMQQMKQAGAEVTMMQIHWGLEYQLEENATQNKIAQELCDIGFDVIVGGHPHVVQPMELLESTVDPNHKTVCIYSLGNAVSNQRQGNISQIQSAHTEDGVLFAVEFEKYSDGKVYVSGVEVLPTWVNMHTANGGREYNILPLDKEREAEWKDLFGLNDHYFSAAVKSYDRTMKIVGEGLTQCQTYLEQAKVDREQYYYDLAHNPEKFATEATEAPVETTAAAETTLPAA
ncbi:MAG: CapA family protein [Oscillospiraceae bacterium]|nr:CapA family protein [Oscillospiraceae bacterium]